jgi:hypothetical protein
MTGRVAAGRTGGAGGGTTALSVGTTDGTGDATGDGNTGVGWTAAAEPDEAGVETTGDGAAVGGRGGGVALIVGDAVA